MNDLAHLKSPPEARARTAGCFRADLLDSNGGSKSGELTERDLETAKWEKKIQKVVSVL